MEKRNDREETTIEQKCKKPQKHYTTLHYTTLHYTTLHYTTLHYTTLHYNTLHYTTPHYTTPHTILLCTCPLLFVRHGSQGQEKGLKGLAGFSRLCVLSLACRSPLITYCSNRSSRETTEKESLYVV